MSQNTSPPSSPVVVPSQKVWVQVEGKDLMGYILEPGVNDVEDLKILALGNNRGDYQAFYHGRRLSPREPIPADAPGGEPIELILSKKQSCKYFLPKVSVS